MIVYTDQLLGKELLSKVKDGVSAIEIAKWAYNIYGTCKDTFTSKGDDALNSLMMMEEGDEFLMTSDQLLQLAHSLIGEFG